MCDVAADAETLARRDAKSTHFAVEYCNMFAAKWQKTMKPSSMIFEGNDSLGFMQGRAGDGSTLGLYE